MPRFFPAFALLVALMAAPLWAQDDTSNRKRAVSDGLANAMADAMPKYNPPPPEPEKTEEEIAEEEALNQPKNDIIRLPQMVVEGERPPIFTEKEIHTTEGLQELAVKRYFGDAAQALNAFSIPVLGMSKEEIALRMWEEDERLRHMADFEERAQLQEAVGEDEEAKETRKLIRDATARSGGGTPIYEKNR